MHDFPLITTLAAAFTAALFFGILTQRIGLSPIVGYLLAGTVIGPYTPGFVGDTHLAQQLAELGVILLMFGVGLHFRLKDLLAVRTVAIPGAIGQSMLATLAGVTFFTYLGWNVSAGIVIGIAMAVASTVMLTRVLTDSGKLSTPAGHAAIGWLIVEDIITVIVLVLLPAMAGSNVSEGGWAETLAIALGKLIIFLLVISFVGSRIVPWILVRVARLRSRELFTLTVLVLSISVATLSSAVFGASMALGAFLAGMLVAQSPVSQQAGAEALPLRDAFAVLFFVAVGMLFDPQFLMREPFLVAVGLFIVLVVKPISALLVVALVGYPLKTGLTVAMGLAQIGEFSFILSALGTQYNLIPEAGQHLLVACAIISLTLNPLFFRAVDPIEKWVQRHDGLWKLLNARSEKLAGSRNQISISNIQNFDEKSLAIIIGYGPVGQQVERLLREEGMETVIIDLNMNVIASLHSLGKNAIFGDATREMVLYEAGVSKASHVILTTSHSLDRKVMFATIKKLNPDVHLIVRTHYLYNENEAKEFGADFVIVDEIESAVALTELVLTDTGAKDSKIREEVARVREQLSPNER